MSQPLALIIEDDPALGTILDKSLKRIGFDTVTDADGNRYADFLADRVPVLVILDLHLPYAFGENILADLRSRPECGDTQIVITTADLYRARELKTKGEQVLMKPVSPLRLSEIATAIFEKHKDADL